MGRHYGAVEYDRIYRRRKPRYAAEALETSQRYLFQLTLDTLPAVGRIVEIGCGTGQFTQLLESRGFRDYVGYDFSAEAVRQARERTSLSVQVRDIEKEPLALQAGDTVVALEVFEHLEDDLALISEWPRGVLCLFSVPVFDAPNHLRWFLNEADVRSRYETCLALSTVLRVDSYRRPGTAPWFFAAGRML